MKRLLLPLLGLVLSTPTLAEMGYIQSRQAKLQQSPSFSSKVVKTLQKGSEVEIITTKGRWYQVRHAGDEAWVTRFLISATPPLDKASVLTNGEQTESLVVNARQRASAVTSAGAARGLNADERQRVSDSGMSNYFSVDIMEEARVSTDEALSYLQKGMKQ